MFFKKTEKGFEKMTKAEVIALVLEDTFPDKAYCKQYAPWGDEYFLTYREVEESFKSIYMQN